MSDHGLKNLELKFTKIKETKQLKHKTSTVFTFLVNSQINWHTLLQVSFYSQARNPVHLHPYYIDYIERAPSTRTTDNIFLFVCKLNTK